MGGQKGEVDRMTNDERLRESQDVQADESLDIGTLTPDDLKGATVYDRHEGTVGTVLDVIMTNDGKVENLVVDVGGFLGLGSHTVGIGARQVSLRHGDDDAVRIYLKLTEDELRALPGHDAPIIPPAPGYRT